MRNLILAIAATWALVLSCGLASAGATGAELQGGWSLEPWVVVSLVAALGWYCVGLARARKIGQSGPAAADRRLAFLLAIFSLLVSLTGPLDDLADELFSAHMVQHLALMLIAAPLLAWARPGVVLLWALPKRARKTFGRGYNLGRLSRLVRWLSHPVSIWIAFCGAFAFWHLPGPYGFALTHPVVHVLEHASFLITAYAFWSVVIGGSARHRLDCGARLLFLSTAAVLSGLPGALMILTPRPFYPMHAAGAQHWGMTLLADQQLAGLFMWIPAGFVYLGAASALFLAWMREAERRQTSLHRLSPALGLAGVALICLCGCDNTVDTRPDGSFGDPHRGSLLISDFGCSACHTIPGIPNADGLVGPPLDRMGRRIYVAGVLRNTPDNLTRWISHPQAVVPGNAMPDMGIPEGQARDIAAYLYTLQ